MRELPEKLNAAQRKFIKEMKEIGVEGEDFWACWDEEDFGVPTKAASSAKVSKLAAVEREAEGVLLSLYNGSTIELHLCKSCGREFATNYRYNRHCSTDCLAESLSVLGVRLDFSKTEEDRWRAEPPATITPTTLTMLKEFARKILAMEPQGQSIPEFAVRGQPEVEDTPVVTSFTGALMASIAPAKPKPKPVSTGVDWDDFDIDLDL